MRDSSTDKTLAVSNKRTEKEIDVEISAERARRRTERERFINSAGDWQRILSDSMQRERENVFLRPL